jgi:hypothetical protein
LTPDSFAAWLTEMQAKGLARSDAECGRLLGMTARQILNMKRKGTDQRTALACAALLRKIKPYQ